METLKITYDKKKLRYGKIIIMSDADVDGSHIKNLLYTLFWNFCPELFINGHVYAGVPPLYRITIGQEYIYLKDDNEFESFKQTNTEKTYVVNRMKGLGEMSIDETEETLIHQDTRIIKQITAINQEKEIDELFEQLMGRSSAHRKQFIKEHNKEARIYRGE